MTSSRVMGIRVALMAGLLAVVACDATDWVEEGSMPLSTDINEFEPPMTRVENVVDSHWGVQVEDPYRWLENDDNEEVRHWFEAQGAHATNVLKTLPMGQTMLERLTELDQGAPYSTYGVRQLANGGLFYLRRNAGESLAKLYHLPAAASAAALLVDPDTLVNGDESHVSIEGYMPSWDGQFFGIRSCTRRL